MLWLRVSLAGGMIPDWVFGAGVERERQRQKQPQVLRLRGSQKRELLRSGGQVFWERSAEEAKAKAKANTGILHFVQDDDIFYDDDTFHAEDFFCGATSS